LGRPARGELQSDSLLDVGCGDGSRLFKYLTAIPSEFHGVEGAPDLEKQKLKIS